MVAFYEDLIDNAVLDTDDKDMDTAAEVVAKLNEIKGEIQKTFAASSPFTAFYTDLDVLARICYALNCELSDIIRYVHPNERNGEKGNG